MKRFLLLLLLLPLLVLADTPPSRFVISQTYDGTGTDAITDHNVGLSYGLDVYNINPTSAPVNSSIIVSGSAVDPRAIRSLTSGSDSVSAVQSGAWSITNISGTVSLPTGAATSANQTTANSSLSSIDGKLNSLGQKTMANSVPVAIASDQSAVPASQSGTWNINNVSGTVSLPTGAATAANQTTANASLSSIDSKLTSPLAVSQSGTWDITNVSGTVSLPTGASTSANQATEITALQLIDNLPHANDTALSNGAPIMGQFDDVGTGTVTENNVSTARITSSRGIHVNLRTAAGAEIGTSGSPVRTDPTGTTSQPVTNATASNFNAQVVGSVAAGATDSGNPVKVGGKYNSTQPTFTDGQRADLQLDRFGSLVITERWGYTVVTNTTTTIKSGAGLLNTICLNTKVNGLTITVYDNTTATGTLIATITPPNGVSPFCMNYGGILFTTGLTVVVSNASQITVSWK